MGVIRPPANTDDDVHFALDDPDGDDELQLSMADCLKKKFPQSHKGTGKTVRIKHLFKTSG